MTDLPDQPRSPPRTPRAYARAVGWRRLRAHFRCRRVDAPRDDQRPHPVRTGLPGKPPDRLAADSSQARKPSPASWRTTCISSRASPRCLAEAKWSAGCPPVKLDTYFQTGRLGERRAASGEPRDRAALFAPPKQRGLHPQPRRRGALPRSDRRAAAARRLCGFPEHPRRLGLNIYQLVPAIAIQDHLLKPNRQTLRDRDGARLTPEP